MGRPGDAYINAVRFINNMGNVNRLIYEGHNVNRMCVKNKPIIFFIKRVCILKKLIERNYIFMYRIDSYGRIPIFYCKTVQMLKFFIEYNPSLLFYTDKKGIYAYNAILKNFSNKFYKALELIYGVVGGDMYKFNLTTN